MDVPIKDSVVIYTDGACKGNPGPGGYGVLLDYAGSKKELAGGFRKTTNNRMELLACIEGLRSLKRPCQVKVTSDSQYIVQAVNEGWARGWRSRGWRLSTKKPAKNRDLWQDLLDLCDTHEVSFEWVKGHAGHPENERCDALAVEAAEGEDLPADTGFESGVNDEFYGQETLFPV